MTTFGGVAASASSVGAITECPYRGLEPFFENDRDYFFGREEEITTIAANLLTSPMTLLYGASGVGKSSIIMAGVVPFARLQRNTTVVLFRSWQDRHLLPLLNRTVAAAVKECSDVALETNCGFDICLASAAAATQTRLTLIFDQFEEFLLYHPSHTQSGSTFDHQFARIVNRAEAPVNVLISIREDWLAKMDRFQRHIPDLLGNLVRLQHLDSAGARRAITEPLVRFNAELMQRNEFALPYSIEPALTNVVLMQAKAGSIVQDGEGSGRLEGSADTEPTAIETPFLQMILTAMWEAEQLRGSRQLRLQTLTELGGASSIVSNYVDNIVTHLNDAHQDICARVFDRLVTPSGSKIAHSADDLVNMTEQDPDAVREVLTELAKHRLLREVGMLSVVRYEIFHDVLAQPILRWRTGYLTAKRERERARVRTERRRKRLAFGASVLTISALAVAFYWLKLIDQERRTALHAVAEIEMAEARRLAQDGRPGESAQKLIAATKQFRSLNEQAGITAVSQMAEELQATGIRHLRSDECRLATPFLEASELVARWTGERRLQTDALIQWATCELQLDHDDRARRLTDDVQTIAKKSGLSAARWRSLGLLEMTLANPAAAGRAFDRAMAEASKTKDDRAAAEVYMAMANAFYDRADYTAARSSYENAVTHARRSGGYEIEVKSVAQLVKVADRLGDSTAKKTFEDQLEVLLSRQTDRIRKVLHENAAKTSILE